MKQDDDATPGEVAAPRTLAQKLDHLFKVVTTASKEATYEDVASGVRQAGGPTISHTYVWQLRTGRKTNPTIQHLRALADFFGVPAAYFLDDNEAAKVDSELELLAALRDAGVRHVAMQASGLSPASLQAITQMIQQARKIEGLDDGAPPQTPGRRATDREVHGEAVDG